MRKGAFGLTAVLVISIVIVSMRIVQDEQEAARIELLKTRAREFYTNLFTGNYGQAWDMTISETNPQRERLQEEYVQSLHDFFATLEDYFWEDPDVMAVQPTHAIVSVKIIMTRRMSNGFGVQYWHDCDKTLWIWSKRNWYLARARIGCDYEYRKEDTESFF